MSAWQEGWDEAWNKDWGEGWNEEGYGKNATYGRQVAQKVGRQSLHPSSNQWERHPKRPRWQEVQHSCGDEEWEEEKLPRPPTRIPPTVVKDKVALLRPAPNATSGQNSALHLATPKMPPPSFSGAGLAANAEPAPPLAAAWRPLVRRPFFSGVGAAANFEAVPPLGAPPPRPAPGSTYGSADAAATAEPAPPLVAAFAPPAASSNFLPVETSVPCTVIPETHTPGTTIREPFTNDTREVALSSAMPETIKADAGKVDLITVAASAKWAFDTVHEPTKPKDIRSILKWLGSREALADADSIPHMSRLVRKRYFAKFDTREVFTQFADVFLGTKGVAHRKAIVYCVSELLCRDTKDEGWRPDCMRAFLIPVGARVRGFSVDERKSYVKLVRMWRKTGALTPNDLQLVKDAWDMD